MPAQRSSKHADIPKYCQRVTYSAQGKFEWVYLCSTWIKLSANSSMSLGEGGEVERSHLSPCFSTA